MKKVVKSLFCSLLAMILIFSSATVAMAKEKVTPVILVHGLGANPIYENPNTKNEKELQNLGMGDLPGDILSIPEITTEVLKMATGKKVNTERFLSGLAEYAQSAHMNCDSDGNPPANEGINNYWTDSLANHKSYYKDATSNEPAIARQLCKSIGAKNVYLFNYDWRVDICETAEKLDDYIDIVKSNTGSKKVTLIGCSLGGSVLSAYIDAHKGDKELDRCVFVNPAYMGVDVAGAYAKDIVFDKTVIKNYLSVMSENADDSTQAFLYSFVSGMTDGILDGVIKYMQGIVKNEKLLNRVYLEVLYPLLGNVPSLWECIPYNTFNKAVKEMSAIGFLDKSSGLYKKISNYHKVQGRLKSNLKAIKKQGVQVAIFANYGLSGIPITSKSSNQTDSLIDVKYASAGATVAKYGKTLKSKGKYVSGDKAINAKTCALPDNTWFIKNIGHVGFSYNSKATQLVVNLTVGKVKCSLSAVKKKYKYSQFLSADANQKLTNI
ncbi:MAG: esterase/lipase family protein [Eubacterium sp.]